MYEDDLLDAYIRRYVSVSKQMVEDYKRHAINAYLTETHAQKPKYESKHRALIEKVLYEEKGWHTVRQEFEEKKAEHIASLASAPYSVKQAAVQLHEHFKKYMENNYLNEKIVNTIEKVFDSDQKQKLTNEPKTAGGPTNFTSGLNTAENRQGSGPLDLFDSLDHSAHHFPENFLNINISINEKDHMRKTASSFNLDQKEATQINE